VTFGSEPDQTLPSGGEVSPDFGRMAAEVAEVYPDLVIYDEDGEPEAVKYDEMASMLWSQLQKQQHTIENQARAIQALRREHEREVGALAKRLARIETRVTGARGEEQR
jgi:hypothetical protein